MRPGSLLIRGGDVVDGTGAPRHAAPTSVCATGRIVEVGADLAPDGEDDDRRRRGRRHARASSTRTPTPTRRCSGTPALDPEPLHGVTTMLVGNCSLSLYPVTEPPAATISDLFAYIEDVPRHLFDDGVPWTWTDYAGYRDAVNARGHRHQPRRARRPQPDPPRRDGRRRVDPGGDRRRVRRDGRVLLDEAMHAGAWGLSTSFLDVDQAGSTGAVPRWPTAPSSTRCSTCSPAHGRGLVEIVPGLLGPNPEIVLRGPGPRCGDRGIPLTWTGFVHTDSNPAGHAAVDRPRPRLAAEGVRIYPQLSPRTVDFRLNWDSSMMFMSMPEGWHQVIAAARGATRPPSLARPASGGRRPATSGTAPRAAMFPHRRPEMVRFVEVLGAENERWLGRSLADLVAERGGHPVRRARRLRAGQRLPARASSPSASPTPTSTAWPARSPTPPC